VEMSPDRNLGERALLVGLLLVGVTDLNLGRAKELRARSYFELITRS
jgi:hypothetical protein